MRRIVLVLIACMLLSTQQAALGTQVFNPFGIVEGMWFPDLTCDLGVGWERIIFDWASHQPNSADDWFTLSVDDRWLKAANACDREVVAIIKNVPAWATDGSPGPGVPRGLDLPVDDPGNIWARFMRKTAQYYASRGVHRFIILNEPDIDRETYGFEFEGELEDYFKMLKIAYLAAKQGNPDVVIHLAATTYWHDANTGKRLYMDRLLERIATDPDAANNDYYFDVLSLHIYFRTETIPQIVGLMRDMLVKNGMGDKAIWINETNAAPNIDPAWPVVRPQFQVTLEMQAAFLVQAAALSLAEGVERIAVYKLYDQNLTKGGESFGILNPANQQPRPAYYAWKTVIEHFRGVETAVSASTERVDIVRLTHIDGRQTFVAWTRNASNVVIEVEAAGDKAYLVDQVGNTVVLRPAEGKYTLTLPSASCHAGCPIGGNVYILIQSRSDQTLQVTEVTGTGRAAIALDE